MEQQDLVLAPTGVETFDQIESLFEAQGVVQIYIKHLPEKQDNEKNQVVLDVDMSDPIGQFILIINI